MRVIVIVTIDPNAFYLFQRGFETSSTKCVYYNYDMRGDDIEYLTEEISRFQDADNSFHMLCFRSPEYLENVVKIKETYGDACLTIMLGDLKTLIDYASAKSVTAISQGRDFRFDLLLSYWGLGHNAAELASLL